MRRILKLENNGAFRIAPSLKVLSKNNYSSPQNTTISNCEPCFYISSHFTNHYAIPNFIKPSINPFQLSPPPPSTNSFLTQFERSHGRNPSRVTFLIEKKRKTTRSILYILTSPWTLISNLKQFPISSWNRSENQSTASSKWKKRERGEKLLPTIPNPLKPSSDLLDLLARPPSTSTGSVGIGPWTQTFVDRGDPLQGIGGEDPEMDEEEEGSGWQWVASRTGTFAWKSWQIGCRATTGSTIASQQQQRRRRRLFLFLNRLDRFFSLAYWLPRWFVCVCVPRFRLRPHQDTTRTGRVYGPAHCIWSQKCHTDAPHALPPRSRTPPAIEISGGWLWKGMGLEKGFGFLFRVCASDNKLARLFEIRSCSRSSLDI